MGSPEAKAAGADAASDIAEARAAAADAGKDSRVAESSAAGERPGATHAKQQKPRKFFFGDVYKDGRYTPLQSGLFRSDAESRWAQWLAPSFLESLKQGDLQSMLRQEAPSVYSFELFTPEFCDILLKEVDHAQSTIREELQRPNGMNRYGIVLNQLGLEPLITALQQKYLLPLQGSLYPEEGAEADDHHCFIVRYRAGEDVGLDMHEDDADVTLNVCLGKEFSGATLSFCGMAADRDHRKLKHTYFHEKGRAVVHLGRHRHGADNIASGERINFILWSTSSKYRGSKAYQAHRMRSQSAADPDKICLSYTHDSDYTSHQARPAEEDAVARGVMLDVVQEREAKYRRPVHNLAEPLVEINKVPSVILFMEGLPAPRVRELFAALVAVSVGVSAAREAGEVSAPAGLLFFVAVQPAGAAPQVSNLCGVGTRPALVVLDIEKECCHRYTGEVVDASALRTFVDGYLKGEISPEPLGAGPGASAAQS